VWNLALDENGTPYIGHPDPDDPPLGPSTGIITVESETRKITRNARFWAIAHYSKHVRRGARVFRTDGVGDSAAQPSAGGVSHVGFRNPDGSMVVVLTNSGEERQIQLVRGSSVGSIALEVGLPADSVLTLQWS
jgi:glucosylceramidase